MRLSLGIATAVVAMALIAGSAPARPQPPAQKRALKAINLAVKKGQIDSASARRYRFAVNRAARLIRNLPRARAAAVSACLNQAAAMSPKLTAPRARAVFGQLARNNTFFASKGPPGSQADIVDADGVLYRYFPGRCFEFHPLGNFGALNAAVSSGNVEKARRLAGALADRGVSLKGGGKGWEYYFDYGGGRAPWLSGMAQAVAAQALSAAAGLEGDGSKFMTAARAAYRSIPGRLVRRVGSGPWIKLYAFNRLTVLNAQLQAVLSLGDYADASGDTAAYDLAAAMKQTAAENLSRFDTGYWSYYALPSTPSPLSYQQYVLQMLKRLAPDDTRFASAATRFAAYEKQPPAFRLSNTSAGAVRFWLSKPASVEMKSPAGKTKRLSLRGGWHKLSWKLPKKAGTYAVSVAARDWAGNTSAFSALPIIKVVQPSTWEEVGSKLRPAQAKSVMDAAEAGAVSSRKATSAVLGQASFSVGGGVADPTQTAFATAQGLNAVRYSHSWPGTAVPAPDPALIQALNTVPTDQRLILELVVDPQLVNDETDSSALASYARALVEQVPSIRDLLVGPAPTIATAANYVGALEIVYDAVKQVAPTVRIASELDGGSAPKATLAAVGDAQGLGARSTPIMDELAFKPAPAAATGLWTIDNYTQLVNNLASAFAGSAQPVESLPILIDRVGVATTIPFEKLSFYPAPSSGIGETAQANVYSNVLQKAVCMANVSGVVFQRVVDHPGTSEPGTSDQSGLYYADGTAKTSAAGVGKTTQSSIRGLRVCPGINMPVLASTLVLPLEISALTPPQVILACTRDCLYLLTLERATDGKPVLAKRGLLGGSSTPRTIQMPPGPALSSTIAYRLRLRLVAQTNPGPVKQYRSPAISVS